MCFTAHLAFTTGTQRKSVFRRVTLRRTTEHTWKFAGLLAGREDCPID
jgi:hypothetical protein